LLIILEGKEGDLRSRNYQGFPEPKNLYGDDFVRKNEFISEINIQNVLLDYFVCAATLQGSGRFYNTTENCNSQDEY